MTDTQSDDIDIVLSDQRIKKWIPIENHSELLTKYIHELGVANEYSIIDIYGIEPELYTMTEYQQLISIVLLFPYSDNFKHKRNQQLQSHRAQVSNEIYFLPQVVSNACGTIALTHAILNNRHILSTQPNTPLHEFYHSTVQLNKHDRAYALANNHTIEQLHHKYSIQGDTEVVNDVDVHYNAFIRHQSHIYELDGTKHQPIDHGTLDNDDDSIFLQNVINIIKTQFIDNDPDNIRFSIQALVKTAT